MKEIKKTKHATKFGSAKGYLLKYSMFSNMPPNKRRSTGRAKNPPNAGPKTLPRLQTKGMIEKARGCSSLSGTNSATIVLIIPTR